MRIDDALVSRAVLVDLSRNPFGIRGFRLPSVNRTKSMAAGAHNRLFAAP
jgi:hypothetical protein